MLVVYADEKSLEVTLCFLDKIEKEIPEHSSAGVDSSAGVHSSADADEKEMCLW